MALSLRRRKTMLSTYVEEIFPVITPFLYPVYELEDDDNDKEDCNDDDDYKEDCDDDDNYKEDCDDEDDNDKKSCGDDDDNDKE